MVRGIIGASRLCFLKDLLFSTQAISKASYVTHCGVGLRDGSRNISLHTRCKNENKLKTEVVQHFVTRFSSWQYLSLSMSTTLDPKSL